MRILALVALSALVACGSDSDSGNSSKNKTTQKSNIMSVQAAGPTAAQLEGPKANQLFGAKPFASSQSPAVLGKYAKGCLAGGEQLAENGTTWQAMRLSRNRNWAHPELIDYVQELSTKVARRTSWAGLYVGDLSQPRGGPMTSGHQSHQVGLDADIWLFAPKRLDLSRSERESLSSTNVRSGDQRSLTSNWTAEHMQVLKMAASDPRVDRIFITPPAKVWMCKNAGSDRAWLQKIRPTWGHNTHFHVRLKCPAGSKTCISQAPTVSQISSGGDGCDSTLQWWVTDALNPKPVDPDAPPPKKRRRARDYVMADLPQSCQRVLESQ